MTATATKRRTKKAADTNGAATNGHAGTHNRLPGTPCVLSMKEVQPSKRNARRRFDETALDELAASIDRLGLLEPIVVRPGAKDGYTIVAGERRWRACRQLKMTEIAATVVAVDAQEADAMGLVENLLREDLSDIEVARGVQALINTGWSQAQVAEALGRSAGYVSNTLRLLKLPESVQERIISGEMSARHGREFLRAIDVPAAVKALEKELPKKPTDEMPTADSFHWHVDDALRRATRRLDESRWCWLGNGGRDIKIKPTAEQLEQLDVDEIDGEKRCRNVKLFDKLMADAMAEAQKKADKRSQRSDAKGKAAAQKMSPAERKNATRSGGEKLKRSLADWRTDWIRWLLSSRIGEVGEGPPAALFIMLASESGAGCHRQDAGKRASSDAQVNVPFTSYDPSKLSKLLALTPAEINRLGREFLRQALFYEGGAWSCVDPREAEALARTIGLDLAQEWTALVDGKQAFAGPLTQRLWNLLNTDDVLSLAKGWNIGVPTAAKKRGVLKLIEAKAIERRLPLPKLIAPVRQPRAKASGKPKRRSAKK